MPRAANKRTVEVPAHVYEDLMAEHEATGVPITQIAARRILGAKTLEQLLEDRLATVERELRLVTHQRC